jgi:hypothetical protein
MSTQTTRTVSLAASSDFSSASGLREADAEGFCILSDAEGKYPETRELAFKRITNE